MTTNTDTKKPAAPATPPVDDADKLEPVESDLVAADKAEREAAKKTARQRLKAIQESIREQKIVLEEVLGNDEQTRSLRMQCPEVKLALDSYVELVKAQKELVDRYNSDDVPTPAEISELNALLVKQIGLNSDASFAYTEFVARMLIANEKTPGWVLPVSIIAGLVAGLVWWLGVDLRQVINLPDGTTLTTVPEFADGIGGGVLAAAFVGFGLWATLTRFVKNRFGSQAITTLSTTTRTSNEAATANELSASNNKEVTA